uniref:phospholipase A1-Igamma2, chloroplastic-like n=1 Tax=Erigeron canadensis TaxID=72917 RepID=UPI001CB9B18E|nr:phospholipase A1-Igamma2, chloroplastic-like [Erigeron canadensis]
MATIKLNFHSNGNTHHLHNQTFTKISTPFYFSLRYQKMFRAFRVKCGVSATFKSIEKTSCVHEQWRDIHGQDNWSKMLNPMDPLLRCELIRYGEMAQACYDAFDNNPYSKYCGSCKVPPKTFFQDLGIDNVGYDITSYIYSSNTSNLIPKFFTKSIHSDGPWNPVVNWMGYVAVSNDETTARLGRRDITISWRGTVTKLEWMEDLVNFLKPVSTQKLASQDPGIKVMAGFLHIYTDKHQKCLYSMFSAREQLLAEIRRLTKIYGQKGEEMSITITGHSLGSALAILSAYDIAESDLHRIDKQKTPISVISFSGPRVGNTRFKKRVEELGIKVLRVFNVHDKVPNVPGVLLNEFTSSLAQSIADWTTIFYSHIGEEIALNHMKSFYVKEKLDLASMHNLELLLHLLDGYHGKDAKFSPATGMDKALVNRNGDILKHEYLIPPNWSQVENKGLRKNANGIWELPKQNGIEDHLRLDEVELHLRNLGLI